MAVGKECESGKGIFICIIEESLVNFSYFCEPNRMPGCICPHKSHNKKSIPVCLTR